MSLWKDDNFSIFSMKKGKPAVLPQIVVLCMSNFFFLKHSLKFKIKERPRAVVCYQFLIIILLQNSDFSHYQHKAEGYFSR